MTKTLSHILCIDDEPDILEIAALCLESVGQYNVTKCNSGASGIEKALDVMPDLIMVDVMMPEMDGPTTFVELRKHDALKDIPIIFMTARVQPAEVQEYMSLGAAGVVSKPFDPMSLSSEIAAIWSNIDE